MKQSLIIKLVLGAVMTASAPVSFAYISGSTGADGAFNPTTSQTVDLPPNGVFNFTDVGIPAGVTIRFRKNANNTPVTILASGNVSIGGVIDVSATLPLDPNDIRSPGLAGPGGFNGGHGGQAGGDASNWVNGLTGTTVGRQGQGPGGGQPTPVIKYSSTWGTPVIGAGGGGAYGTAPNGPGSYCPVTPGATYGHVTMLPLVGGSGGGGGAGGSVLPGMGGGGGGGAILIAASGIINVAGSILANGGTPVSSTTNGRGSQGGAGSGGAIRLIATTISGNGTISAMGGSYSGEITTQNVGTSYNVCSIYSNSSQNGGAGRIRLESETLTRTAATAPLYVGGSPSVTFIPGLPTLSIASIGGVAVPAVPTGSGDVSIPSDTPNPVTVVLTTKGVTVGSTIRLTLLPASGVATSVTSAPTTGSIDNATTSVSINIPNGASSLQASVTYTIVASLGIDMSRYAQGEQVEKIRLSATLGGPSTASLITVSGKEFTVPASALAGISS